MNVTVSAANHPPNSTSLARAAAYASRVHALSKAYAASFFWKRYVEPFDAAFAALRDREISFEEAWRVAAAFPQEPPVPFGEPAAKQSLLAARLRYWLHRNGIRRLTRADAEHLSALLFITKLKRKGAFADYEALRNAIGVPSSMLLARHYYYATVIDRYRRQVFGDDRPLRVLEIGGGGGTLARVLHARGMVRAYYDLDLPQVLLSAALTLARCLPYEPLRFGGPDLPGNDAAEGTFNFYPAQYFDRLPRGHFDLIVNISSFQEMDVAMRDMYIRSVPDLLARPGIFFNVNRRQDLPQADGSTSLNHPLLYPYAREEEVLEWGTDPAQDTVRTNAAGELFAMLPRSFAIMRVGVVR